MFARLRPPLVLLHRWLGLVMAGFLLLASLTGSILVWNDELDGFVSPHLFYVQEKREETLDTLALRDMVLSAYPNAQIMYVPLERHKGESVRFKLQPKDKRSLANDEVFVDPWAGIILGERKWGDISQGSVNLMPFIYRLHQSLALDVVGTYLLGVIALLWTIDCFIGLYLTFPVSIKSNGSGDYLARIRKWPSRWKPAWRVRWLAGSYKLNFDLHRAGGLWIWAALFIFAWSSVAFNLGEVYTPVMRTLFAYEPSTIPKTEKDEASPYITWEQARQYGRGYMQEYAKDAGFNIVAEGAIAHDAKRAIFRYDVRSSLDVRDHGSKTRVFINAQSGELIKRTQPTGAFAEDTIRMWLTSLHMAALWGLPFKILVFILGIITAMLCVTGVVIWNRKRQARTK